MTMEAGLESHYSRGSLLSVVLDAIESTGADPTHFDPDVLTAFRGVRTPSAAPAPRPSRPSPASRRTTASSTSAAVSVGQPDSLRRRSAAT